MVSGRNADRFEARRRTWQNRVRSGESYRRIPLGHFPNVDWRAPARRRDLIERLEKDAPPSPPVPLPRSASAFTLRAVIDRYERMRQTERARIKALPEAIGMLRRKSY
jgi:hypothetical protein